MTTEPWASVEDLAKQHGVARDSVYRWIAGRGLPAHKVGRLRRLRLTAVGEWVGGGGAGAHDGPDEGRKP